MRFLDNKMYLDSIKKVALNNQVNFDKFNRLFYFINKII